MPPDPPSGVRSRPARRAARDRARPGDRGGRRCIERAGSWSDGDMPRPVEWYLPVDPPPMLDKVLACSWTAEPTGVHRLTPDACCDLLRIDGGRFVLCGPEHTSWTFELPQGSTAVGVRFRPGLVRSIFGLDVATITDRRVPLDEIVAPAVADHAEAVLAAAAGPGCQAPSTGRCRRVDRHRRRRGRRTRPRGGADPRRTGGLAEGRPDRTGRRPRSVRTHPAPDVVSPLRLRHRHARPRAPLPAVPLHRVDRRRTRHPRSALPRRATPTRRTCRGTAARSPR